MRLFINYTGILIFSFFILSCEDEIELDLPEGDVGLVVDGMITTLEGPHVVKLSFTDNFNSTSSSPKATGAAVKIVDDQNFEMLLSETTPGTYESSPTDKGEIGRTYHLEITYDGKDYRSNDELMQKAPEIENLRLVFLPKTLFSEEGFYAFFDFQEDPSEKNAFRIVQFYDDSLANAPSDIIAFDDEFFNGDYVDSLNFSEKLEVGDKYKVQIWSLSAGAVNYLGEFADQASGTGGPFDVPPAPIYGNVFNVNDPDELVWGYFSASDINSDSVVVAP